MSAEVSVYERDVWIVKHLQQAPSDRRTIRDIWMAAQQPRILEDTGDDIRPLGGLADSVTLPSYHRTVDKLVARGQLEVENADATDGPRRYRVAPQVSALTALSQTDLNDALWALGAAQALALYADTVDQFERDAATVLRRAAEGLRREEPRALILQMLKDRGRELDEDIADLRDPATHEDEHRRRLQRRLQDFGRFVHGELGLNPSVWRVPTIEEIDERAPLVDATIIEAHVTPPDWEPVADELAQHVFGETFLIYEEVRADSDAELLRPPLVVAGSDGSSHVGVVRGMPAAAYSDIDRLLMTFNNSAGYVEVPETHPARSRLPSPYYGIPVTRSAVEDPSNKGMIISRPWFPNLDDGEFEHMKKAALDVVQFRVDAALLAGAAQPYGSHPVKGGEALPRPNVLIRDGTVSPQARELQNYTNQTEYGLIVREGIQLSYRILRLVMESERRVFAGAVKSTQLRTFSKIVNWYIQRGSAATLGTAIDPTWDAARMNSLSDSVAMTRLLASLPELSRRTQYYRTCVIVRPFPAMVSQLFRSRTGTSVDGWFDFFEAEATADIMRYRDRGGNRPFFAGHDVRDDDYVKLCAYADYGMFYFGKPGGSPQITFPRFEFLDSIRSLWSPAARAARVAQAVELVMRGVDRTKWSLDYEHNMMTGRKLPKIVPFVVQQSHEMCKVLGHKLANELQQVVAASLSTLKGLRGISVPKVEIEPATLDRFKRYLQRMRRGARQQGEALFDEVAGGDVAGGEMSAASWEDSNEAGARQHDGELTNATKANGGADADVRDAEENSEHGRQ